MRRELGYKFRKAFIVMTTATDAKQKGLYRNSIGKSTTALVVFPSEKEKKMNVLKKEKK